MTREHPAPTTASTKAEKRSVDEHAVALGHAQRGQFFVRTKQLGHERLVTSWQHAAAAQLHGWHEHVHHAGAPLELSADDYQAALKAASEPNSKGDYVPHRPALSPFAPRKE